MSALQRKAPVSRGRLIALGVSIAVIFVMYGVRLFTMQVLDGYIYLNRAEATARRSEPIFAQRGQILDRTGTVSLARNRTSFALTIVPAEVGRANVEAYVIELAQLLGRDPQPILERLERRRAGSFEAIEVVTGLDLEQLTRVAERAEEFPGLAWYTKPERVYPQGPLTGHVVGYVGDITPEELQVLFNEGYTVDSILGKSGVEEQYDQVLRGENGRRFRTVDARGRRVGTGEDILPPVPGEDLVLTIDSQLQELATRALGPRIGSVVVLDAQTAAVRAMVSYPRFDPNEFTGVGSSGAFRRLALDTRSPFINRPIQSAVAPASTFKILMTAAILEEDAFDPAEEILCEGQFRFGNRVFNDWLEYGHGPVNLAQALAQSCNVYYWNMGADHLTVDQIIDYAARLGLGRSTGIDIPGETAGLVPSPAWKEQTFNAGWVGGDTVNMSIGEGFLQVTPLQLGQMVLTIVNDGQVLEPFIVAERRDPVTGSAIERTERTIVRDANISRETLEAVRSAMRGVITEGTANVVITTPAVAVAGKTGTGQVGSDENWTSWFVAYAPYGESVPRSEQIVVVVMVDAANDWEWWAPKAANIILHGWFTGLGYDDAVEDLRRAPRPLWYL